MRLRLLFFSGKNQLRFHFAQSVACAGRAGKEIELSLNGQALRLVLRTQGNEQGSPMEVGVRTAEARHVACPRGGPCRGLEHGF